MIDDATDKAFSAIHDVASRLLPLVPPDAIDISGGLELIMSLARYQHDVRSVEEIKKSQAK